MPQGSVQDQHHGKPAAAKHGKQLAGDPWTDMDRRYPAGARVRGRITNVTDFGVFVEIEDGVEGMVHVSQLSRERVDNPRGEIIRIAPTQRHQDFTCHLRHVAKAAAPMRELGPQQRIRRPKKPRGLGIAPIAKRRGAEILIEQNIGAVAIEVGDVIDNQ